MDGVVPAGEVVLWPWGGGPFRVTRPALICVWAVGMAQIQGTVPTEQPTDPTTREHMQRLIHYHVVHDADVH